MTGDTSPEAGAQPGARALAGRRDGAPRAAHAAWVCRLRRRGAPSSRPPVR